MHERTLKTRNVGGSVAMFEPSLHNNLVLATPQAGVVSMTQPPDTAFGMRAGKTKDALSKRAALIAFAL